jgi:hypothetical protein
LGQTEEASRALELSQEFESLSFIRDHSQGSPDLLPGLCLYSERWFQNEVFPHFRDLQRKQASLTEYFADEDVQLYLEELTTEAEPTPWTAASTTYAASPRREVNLPAETQAVGRSVEGSYTPRGTATMDAPIYAASPEPLSATPTSPPVTERHATPPRSGKTANRDSRPTQPPAEAIREQPTNGARPVPPRRPAGTQFALRLDRILLLAALGLLGIMLLGFLFGKLLNRPQPQVANSSISTSDSANSAQTGVGAATGFSEIAATQRQSLTTSAPLTEETAPDVIQSWLSAKAAAMGETHQIDQLEQILVEPALTQQKARAEEYQAQDSHWKYEHSDIEIVSVETSGADAEDAEASEELEASEDANVETAAASPDPAEEAIIDSESASDPAPSADAEQAIIEALVSEKGELYVNDQLDSSSSYDSTVRVRYTLVKQDGQWKIADMVAE